MTISLQNTPTSTGFDQTGISLLPQWGLIFVEGDDSASFLQNQLTNSVLGMKSTPPGKIASLNDSVRLVGYCNPKGRLMASAWVTLYSEGTGSANRYALFISRDIAASFAKRLSMFILRSKVTVKDVSDQWNVLGFYGDEQEAAVLALSDQTVAMMLPEVLVNNYSYSRALIAQPISEDTHRISESALLQWNDLEVLSAIPRIVLATQEQFVPQMINFESVGGVDFKKGCYPGQEIVARSQYRGSIKRRLQLAHLDSDILRQAVSPGTELFLKDDPTQPAGMVVLSSVNRAIVNRVDFQIECKLEAIERGEIHLGSSDGPVLKIDQLPYPLIEI